MRFGVVALAHADPPMLEALVRELSPLPVFLHVDRPALRRGFLQDLALPANVHVNPEPLCLHWGGFSVLQAMFETVEWAMLRPEGATLDTFVFLSGSCYPIQPIEEFTSYLAKSRPVHCRAFDLEQVDTSQMGIERITARHFLDGVFGHAKKSLGLFGSGLRRGAKFAATPFKLPLPDQINACGSQWTALPRTLCEELVSTYRQGGFEYLRNSFAPDELAIPSFVYNSPWGFETQNGGLDPANGLSVATYSNFHWLKQDMSGYVSREEIQKARQTGKFFVRKVSSANLTDVRNVLSVD